MLLFVCKGGEPNDCIQRWAELLGVIRRPRQETCILSFGEKKNPPRLVAKRLTATGWSPFIALQKSLVGLCGSVKKISKQAKKIYCLIWCHFE